MAAAAGLHPILGEPIATAIITDPVISLPEKGDVPQGKDDRGWKSDTLLLFVIGIIISIIIFIVIISIYDVIKEGLIVSYTNELSQNSDIADTLEKAMRMRIESEASLSLAMAFSLIAIAVAVALLPLLFLAYYKVASN